MSILSLVQSISTVDHGSTWSHLTFAKIFCKCKSVLMSTILIGSSFFFFFLFFSLKIGHVFPHSTQNSISPFIPIFNRLLLLVHHYILGYLCHLSTSLNRHQESLKCPPPSLLSISMVLLFRSFILINWPCLQPNRRVLNLFVMVMIASR